MQIDSSEHLKRRRGFSLFELLFVVAIICIVAALAIPSLLNSRKAAHEATSLSYMRTIGEAQELYRNGNNAYAADIGTLVAAGLIPDPGFDQFGYNFGIGGATANYWSATAAPINPGITGDRYFFIDSTGVIRVAFGGPANSNSEPLNSNT